VNFSRSLLKGVRGPGEARQAAQLSLEPLNLTEGTSADTSVIEISLKAEKEGEG